MSKQSWKPGNMLYPLPVVMVSVADQDGNANIITVAWAGTICTNPPMVSISVRPERHSYDIIKQTGEFVINLTTEDLAFATDYCGVRSGRDVDKFKEQKLTAIESKVVSCPSIGESPVNIECKVTEIKELGSHDMFLAEIVSVSVDDSLMDETGRLCLDEAGLIAYNHGHYFPLKKKEIGKFGYSVMKPKTKKRLEAEKRKKRHSSTNKYRRKK